MRTEDTNVQYENTYKNNRKPAQSIVTLYLASARWVLEETLGMARPKVEEDREAKHEVVTPNDGCAFLVTNEDSTYPTAEGLLPRAGSVSAPLRFALGKDPVAIGKPKGTMLDCIKAKCVTCVRE